MIVKVKHNRWGEGIVEKTKYNGQELIVRFDKGFKALVKKEEIQYLTMIDQQKIENAQVECLRMAATTVSISDHEEELIKKPVEDAQTAREMIESIRMGIVPIRHIDKLSIGREKEFEKFQKWLKKRDNNILQIVGPYGMGKTYLLRQLYNRCLNDGYLVSLVEIDPQEAPFNKPKRVYSKIVKNLRFKEAGFEKNLEDLLEKYSKSKSVMRFLKDHAYLTTIFQKLGGPEKDECIRWIKGDYKNDYSGLCLYEDGTSANIYCYILSGISSASKKCGFKGMIIFFDEAENIEGPWLTKLQKDRANNFFRGIVMLAQNDQRLTSERFNEVDRGREGKKTRLIYSRRCDGRGPIYYAYKPDKHSGKINNKLKLVFASTNMQNNSETKWSTIKLDILNEDAQKALIKKIASLYSSAYPISFQEDILEKVFINTNKVYIKNNSIRIFIKSIIELLDFIRYYPERDLDEFK